MMHSSLRRIALGCGALAATAGLAACSSASGPASSGGSGADTALTVMTPAAKSDVSKVTWNVGQGEPTTMDPFKSADNTPNIMNSNMCENLLVQTPDYQIKPNLASAVKNPDPLHWVYDLRSDVTFWDGKPMTAEDVAWSLQHNLTDPTTLYNFLFANVKGVAVTGAHQVTVSLKRPDYLFNDEMASFAGVVVEKAYYEAHAKTFGTPNGGLMCTGPYELSKWNKGESIIATKNPHYWNKDLQPKVGEIDFTFLTDDSTITAGLLSGQIDGMWSIPVAGIPQMKTSATGKLYFGDAPINFSFIYVRPNGPMGNPEMRKALQMAIDWKGLAKSFFHGAAVPIKLQTPSANFGFAKSALDAYEQTLPEPASGQYDAAKKILAGVPASVKSQQVEMIVPDNVQDYGLAVKDAADRIGLNFKLKVVPVNQFPNYNFDAKTRGNADILFVEYWPGTPDPLDWLSNTAVPKGFFNQYNYAGIEKQFNQARATRDPAARARIVVAMETKLHDDLLPLVPGVSRYNSLWMNNRITGPPASFVEMYSPWAAYLGGSQ